MTEERQKEKSGLVPVIQSEAITEENLVLH